MSLTDPLADARTTWAGKREALGFVQIVVRADGFAEFQPLDRPIARLETLCASSGFREQHADGSCGDPDDGSFVE